jgi:metallo-beta-lactamase class B
MYLFKKKDFDTRQVYKSDKLIILQLAPNSYQHISFLKTNDFGNVPCNGLVVVDDKEAIIFDTPTDDKGSEELILWLTETQKCKIKAIIPTHFHDDCLGGLGIFEKYQIPSYANEKTITLAKENDSILPQNGFKDSLSLALGHEKVSIKFIGEGHSG